MRELSNTLLDNQQVKEEIKRENRKYLKINENNTAHQINEMQQKQY